MLPHTSCLHRYSISRHHLYYLAPLSLCLLLIILPHRRHSEPVDRLWIQVRNNTFMLRALVDLSELLLIIDPHSYAILQHIAQFSLGDGFLAFFQLVYFLLSFLQISGMQPGQVNCI